MITWVLAFKIDTISNGIGFLWATFYLATGQIGQLCFSYEIQVLKERRMKIDRTVQKGILSILAESYPNRNLDIFNDLDDDQQGIQQANLMYLEEHGLVESGLKMYLSGDYAFSGARITADGIDFLADDGGLAAILGTVTVKFHEDTLRALMTDRIEAADLPQPEKKKLLDGLRSLPAETIKHLTMKLMDKGLENLPGAIQAIQTYL